LTFYWERERALTSSKQNKSKITPIVAAEASPPHPVFVNPVSSTNITEYAWPASIESMANIDLKLLKLES